MEQNKCNTGKTWKTINELLNRGNASTKTTEVEKLRVLQNGESKVISDDYEIATEFNNFFVGVWPNLAGEIPKVDIDCKAYLGSKQNSQVILLETSDRI